MSLMNGLWISTDEFNEKSELSNMVIMIEGNGAKKKLFISMFENGNTILSDVYDIYVIPSPDLRSSKYITLCYSNISFMKKIMKLELDTDGHMILQWGDTIYYEGIKF